MSKPADGLTEAERADLVARLIEIQEQLDHAGEALAAVHISHALDHLASNPGNSGEMPAS